MTYKLSGLMRGWEGIPIIQSVITLFKSSIRPHLEYTIPVWAAISDKEVQQLQKVQTHGLVVATGAKANSSVAGIQVITGACPFRIRKRELCMREFSRILSKYEEHILKKLGGKLNGHLMASCVRNIRTKYYQNLITGFQVTSSSSSSL